MLFYASLVCMCPSVCYLLSLCLSISVALSSFPSFLFPFLLSPLYSPVFFLSSRSLFCLRILSFLSNFLCHFCLCLSCLFFSLSPHFFLSCDCATRSRLGIVLARHRLISSLCRLVSEKCGGWRNCHTYFNNHHGISITIMILPYRARARNPCSHKDPSAPTYSSLPSCQLSPLSFHFSVFLLNKWYATDNSSINSA